MKYVTNYIITDIPGVEEDETCGFFKGRIILSFRDHNFYNCKESTPRRAVWKILTEEE